MQKNINYVNALPDFLAMQRMSFCWFITQGLTEELTLFSKIYDFTQNTEYIIFSNEYSLIKPPYSLRIAKKYSGNYRAQLVIPIEIRYKTLNEVYFQSQFPILNLPLMTTYATFIINGCERVIVSQIIRSPGIYFEKNKTQKNHNKFNRKLSANIHRLRTFLPEGEAFLSEFDLLSSNAFDLNPKWEKTSILYYSFNSIQKYTTSLSFYFLNGFKFYSLILKNLNLNSKLKLIILVSKWLNKVNSYKNSTDPNKAFYSLQYFQFLLKTLIKYIVVKDKFEQFFKYDNFSKISESQILQLAKIYSQIVFNSQFTIQSVLNSKNILVQDRLTNWFLIIDHFYFLKQNIQKPITDITNFKKLVRSSTFRPIIYFSTSLKDQIKYRNIILKDDPKPTRLPIFSENNPHHYFKTKSQLLLYQKNIQLKQIIIKNMMKKSCIQVL